MMFSFTTLIGDVQLSVFEEMQPHAKAWIGRLFLASFVCVSNVLLLNLLIAMMSRTYEAVQESAQEKFYYVKAKMIYFYDSERMHLPVPLNLVAKVIELPWSVAAIFRGAAACVGMVGGGAAVAPIEQSAAAGSFAKPVAGQMPKQAVRGCDVTAGATAGATTWWCNYCFFTNDATHTTLFCVACGRFAVPMTDTQVRKAHIALCVFGAIVAILTVPLYAAGLALCIGLMVLRMPFHALGWLCTVAARRSGSGTSSTGQARVRQVSSQRKGAAEVTYDARRRRTLSPAISHALFHAAAEKGKSEEEEEQQQQQQHTETDTLVSGGSALALEVPVVHKWLLQAEFDVVLAQLGARNEPDGE